MSGGGETVKASGQGGFSGDQGQALIIIALAVTVLLGAVALGVDWGYGLTQRRVMQNAADAGTMAAAKVLATSVIAVPGPGSSTSYLFSATKELLYCRALEIAQANQHFGVGALTVTIEFGVVSSPNNPSSWDPPSWQAPFGGVNCAAPASSTAVHPDTRFVRVRSTTSHRSFFATVVGQPTIVAGAEARARLTGATVPLNGPTWPMVRHYDPDDFVNQCGNPCNPTTAAPVPFWCTGGPQCDAAVYGNFKAAVDLSRYSTYYPYTEGSATNVEQLLTAWDQTGNRTDRSANGQNCPGTWNSRGDHDPTNHNITCDVPNWFYYSFGGSLSLDTAWGTVAKPLPAGQAALQDLGNRNSICPAPPYVSAPSCGTGNHQLGDWVEVTGGNIGSNYSGVLRDRIESQGSLTAFSSQPYPNKNQPCVDPGGPNESNCYGKALTMLIFLWDCAQDFNGGNWGLIGQGNNPDCYQLNNSGNKIQGTNTQGDVHRVHLFTAAPFTFYKALVNTSSIDGFWGGAWGSASSCMSCTLNPLSNSAYLDGE